MAYNHNQQVLDDLLRRMGADKNGTNQPGCNGHALSRTVATEEVSDETIIEKIRGAANAPKFATLFDDGDISAYDGDESRGDLALLSILAFYTQDVEQLDRLYRSSALMRLKWERYDYRKRTIEEALLNLNETFDWTRAGATKDHLILYTAPGTREPEGDQPPSSPGSNPLLQGLVDLADAIENGIQPPEELEPGVLLKGQVHHFFAPAAVGKTFLALWLAKNAIARGETVLYIDEENGPYIMAERLETMGIDTDAARKYLKYLPSPSIDLRPESLAHYIALIDTLKPDLVIFDSWIKFLMSAGLEENDNDAIAKWAEALLKPARDRGVTSVVLDHVPHDGTRSRGASRKRDEVDVQYNLTKTEDFNRETVGEVKLKLEKDRLGWLPRSTTFSIGGSEENGFIFARSAGTIDMSSRLKDKEEVALNILKEHFGMAGARHNEWQKKCLRGMSKTSFGRARDALIRVHLVRKEDTPNGSKYYPVENGPGSTGGGPTNSSLISQMDPQGPQGPLRVHGPDGGVEGPQGPPPFRGGPMDPPHGATRKTGVGSNPSVEAALQAMRHGNGPRKAVENVLGGTQKLPDLAKSVMNYYGAKRFDGWEEWLEPVVDALELLASEDDVVEELV